MPRTIRVAAAVAILLAVLVGTALAARQAPVAPARAPLVASPAATPAEDAGPKHPKTDEDRADASGKTVSELRAMRDAGAGWGSIAHELGLSPGIGIWMRNPATGDSSDVAAAPDDPNDGPPASPGSVGRNHAPGLAKPRSR